MTPTTAYANDSLNCSVNVTDSDVSFVDVNFTWYVNSARNISFDTMVNCSIESICYSDTLFTNLSKYDNYTCSAIGRSGPFYSNWTNSTEVMALNSLPDTVTLLEPTDGNDSLIERKPRFSWEGIDNDDDNLTFYINITNSVCADIDAEVTDSNFTPDEDLCTYDEAFSNPYYWEVRAHDGEGYGLWSDSWNFSIESVAIINLINGQVDFGNLLPRNISDNVGDDSFIVENAGNVFINVSIVANNPFTSVTLDNKHFQTKVNESDETYSFDWTTSIITWMNMSSGYKQLISNLNYSDATNEAKIELKIDVPDNEPSGEKSTTITLIGEQS